MVGAYVRACRGGNGQKLVTWKDSVPESTETSHVKIALEPTPGGSDWRELNEHAIQYYALRNVAHRSHPNGHHRAPKYWAGRQPHNEPGQVGRRRRRLGRPAKRHQGMQHVKFVMKAGIISRTNSFNRSPTN